MKKLLVLALVFSLASVANGALTGVELSVGGEIDGPGNVTEVGDMPICTYLEIDVHGPAGYNWTGDIFIMGGWPGAGGEWGDNIGPWDPECSGYYYENQAYPIITANAGADPRVYRAEYAGFGFGYEFDALTFNPEGPQPVGGKQFDFIYHCCGPDTEWVTIELWDASDMSGPQDSILIHQIPEPATIALLGLGGLALLRRRK